MRRRPRLATSVGAAAALGLLALYTQASWPWRIGVTAAVVVLWAGYWLWTRRGEIEDETRADIAVHDEHTDGGTP